MADDSCGEIGQLTPEWVGVCWFGGGWCAAGGGGDATSHIIASSSSWWAGDACWEPALTAPSSLGERAC